MSNEGLRQQMYGNLNLKETDELLDIWQTNNRGEWSDDAFEVVESILKERGVEIPQQDEPVYEAKIETPAEETPDEDEFEEWEAKLLDNDNQPDFYDTLEVLSLKDNIDKVAKAIIIIYILLGLLNSQFVSAFLWNTPLSFSDRLQFLPLEIYNILSTVLNIVVIYFPLKALAHILRILMEMEFRSRKGV